MSGEFWRYARSLGPRGFLFAAWEKLAAGKKRYRSGAPRQMPPLAAHVPPEPLPPAGDRSPSVLYLIHCFYPQRRGGTERFVLTQARETMGRGGSVRVLTASFGPPEGAERFGKSILWKDYVFDGVSVTAFCYKRLPLGAFYKRMAESDPELEAFFAFLWQREAFDLVHAAYAQPFAAVLRLCREQGLPYIVTATDFCLPCYAVTLVRPGGTVCPGSEGGEACGQVCKSPLAPDPTGRHAAAARLLLGARHVTAPSAFVASVLEAEFPGLRVRVVPHGIAPAFTPGAPRTQVRRFLYAGNLSALKGVDTLIAAFRALPGDLSLEIWGAGSAPDLYRLKKLTKGDGRIRFRGVADPERMPEVYSAADCAVMPALWPETYSYYLREALACGCLAIASRLGALPEPVTEGKNGFLFVSGDVGDLKKALSRAAAFDPEAYVQTRFPTPAVEAEQYGRIYHDAAFN